MNKRRLLALVKSEAECDTIIGLLKRERRWYTYEKVPRPADNDPTDVVYEIYCTTPTNWHGHGRLVAFVEGMMAALAERR